MKKILVPLIIVLALSIVGCSNSNITTNAINIMSVSKAEKVAKYDYAAMLNRLIEKTLNNDELVTNKDDESKYEYKYDEKYLKSDVPLEKSLGGTRDRYKDFIEGISTFRTEDEEINKLHDNLIEVCLDIHTMINEAIELEKQNIELDKVEATNLDEIKTKNDKMMEAIEKCEILETMINNQIEQIDNIVDDISTLLGVEIKY